MYGKRLRGTSEVSVVPRIRISLLHLYIVECEEYSDTVQFYR